jgi:hypothetical protein
MAVDGAASASDQTRMLPSADGASGGRGRDDGTASAPDATDAATLRRRIREMIDRSSCPETCPKVTITAEPALAVDDSRGQRILLLDDGLVVPAAARYRSRTFAFLRTDRQGTFSPGVEQGTRSPRRRHAAARRPEQERGAPRPTGAGRDGGPVHVQSIRAAGGAEAGRCGGPLATSSYRGDGDGVFSRACFGPPPFCR